MVFMVLLFLLLLAISLLSFIPTSPSGSVVLGNTDVILVAIFSSDVEEVVFSQTKDSFNASFYMEACSAIGTGRQLLNYSNSLAVTDNSQYRLEERYIIKGSAIQYFFLATESLQTPTNCVAMLYIIISRLSQLLPFHFKWTSS